MPPRPPGSPTAVEFPDSRVLPQAPAPFAGTINPSAQESTPAWPPTLGAPEGAPNVLLIITDHLFSMPANAPLGPPVRGLCGCGG